MTIPNDELTKPALQDSKLLDWDILIYRVPTEPARKRTYIWRQLKKLGVIYLQHGVCILPHSPAHQAAFQNLVSKVNEFEGEATLLKITSENLVWQNDIIQRFHKARDEERLELNEVGEQLRHEIKLYSEHGPYKYALLDRLEERLEQCKRDLAQIKEHDFFDTGANAALDNFRQQLDMDYQEFCQEVWSRHDAALPSVEK